MPVAEGENAAGNRLPMPANKPNATWTDKSGSCTTGAAAQTIAAANTARRYFIFQNVSDTVMWIAFGTTAVAGQPSFQIAAGATLELRTCVDGGAISMLCATTGKQFTAKEA